MVRRNMLRRKLVRDMSRSAMQFLAMMMLCFLGTWVFAGLDANWRMEEVTIESWLEDGRIPDFWVKGSGFSRQDLYRIRSLDGIALVQPRITLDAECPDQPGKVTAAVHATEGEFALSVPLLRSGEMLTPEDARGCLAEEQFAAAQGWQPGDTVTLTLAGTNYDFILRGTVLSPEYLMTAKDMAPDPSTYGFVLISSEALPGISFNELLIALSPEADAASLEAEIRRIVPEAIVLTQETHSSTVHGRSYVSLFRNMSYLFPALAYFVAALVVVTTISRMMDTQRIQMGTLKALGYDNGKIRRHYLSYALWPSLIGSAAGLIAAQYTLPQVLWKMLEVNLRVPEVRMAPISPLSWGLAAAEVLLAVLTCNIHEKRTARESTAELLRPRPPRAGARIFLERISFLWRRFSFNTKMIIRNIFRNKGRTLMSMVGMLFCNMLIICSFGLQESIPWFVSEYFHTTLRYDVRVDLESGEAGTLDSYRRRLNAETMDGIMELSVSLRTEDRSRTSLLTVMPEDTTLIAVCPGQTVGPLPEAGMVLTEKQAEKLGVQEGEFLSLWLTGEDEPLEIQVVGLAEVNIGQGAYMSQHAWESLRKGGFTPTALLLKAPTADTLLQVEDMDETESLKYPADQYTQTLRVMDSAASAFSILSGVALGLAFVICYNMGLLNFTERTREYATLKVLGYHQREIRRLMLRENALTAILGVAAGVIPGILLVQIILTMCEFENMVFVAHITWPTVLLCSLGTFAFTMLIELLLTRKVKRIDMVEALKSVE